MDRVNLRNMDRICGGDFAGKLHLLMGLYRPPEQGPRKAALQALWGEEPQRKRGI